MKRNGPWPYALAPRRGNTPLMAVAFLALGLPFSGARAAVIDASVNPMDKPQVKQGAATYQQNCAACHGATARGGEAPNLIDSYLVRHDKNGDLIAGVLQNGRQDRGMPAFPALGSAQIASLVAFLHARIEVTNSRSATGPAGGYVLNALLTGDVAAGRRYFETTGKCSRCHSTQGDLAGIAGKYPPAELEARFLSPHAGAVTAIITVRASRQAVRGRLLHRDPFFVAIVDESGRYRSWPIEKVKIEIHDPLEVHRELLRHYKNKDIHDVLAYLETLK
jgi:cytochrome c oxidase cbb3-type subunit 3